MKITILPQEVLCNILEFMSNENYFNAINSNVFPIDQLQYNRNLQIQNARNFELQKAIENREKYRRIHQGKKLILSHIKQLSEPQLEQFVDTHIHDWEEEIDQYFLDNPSNGIATTILNYALND